MVACACNYSTWKGLLSLGRIAEFEASLVYSGYPVSQQKYSLSLCILKFELGKGIVCKEF